MEYGDMKDPSPLYETIYVNGYHKSGDSIHQCEDGDPFCQVSIDHVTPPLHTLPLPRYEIIYVNGYHKSGDSIHQYEDGDPFCHVSTMHVTPPPPFPLGETERLTPWVGTAYTNQAWI